VAAEATAEPTEGGAIFARDGLRSMACVTIFRRLAVRASLASRCPPIEGVTYFTVRYSVL
jgi:hypothetical protein